MLAHTFINDLLDNEIAEKNFNWNGYQPPLTKLDAEYLIDQGYIKREPDVSSRGSGGLRVEGSSSTSRPLRSRTCTWRPSRSSRVAAAEATAEGRKDAATRFLWPSLAIPGTAWLLALFVVPFYGIMAVAFSSQLDILGQPIPAWNPLDWDFTVMQNVIDQSINGVYRPAWEHTFIYAAIAMSLCVLIGYPVAYYVARLAGGNRGLLLALILAPWWINYLTRMLSWVGILGDEGYANDIVGILRVRQGRLARRAVVRRGRWRWSTATCRSSSFRSTPTSTGSTSDSSRHRATSARTRSGRSSASPFRSVGSA